MDSEKFEKHLIGTVATDYSKLVNFILFQFPLWYILVLWPELSSSCFARLYKIFSNIIYSLTHAKREVRPNMAPFFFRVCLRKFIGTRQLFVPRPYFQLHWTEKRSAKLLLALCYYIYVVLSSLCPTIFVYVSPSILPLCIVITLASSSSIVMVTYNIIQ